MAQNNPNNVVSFDNTLDIQNFKNADNQIYDITAPFHLTMRYNMPEGPNFRTYFVMFSPSKTIYHQDVPEAYTTKPLHRHNYFELMIVLKGNLIQIIEEKEYMYPAGACCLINRNVSHTERFIGEATCLFMGISMSFAQELLDASYATFSPAEVNLADNRIFQFMKENMSPTPQKYYLDIFPSSQNQSRAARLHAITDQILRNIFIPGPGSTYFIKGLTCELFDFLNDDKQYYLIPITLNSDSSFLLYSRIRHLMYDADGRISRSQLEKALNYNGSYLNSITKKYTGMNLFQYGMTFCLEKAALLLATTELSISEIIKQLQFTNHTHFYKLFKEHYGMLPKEYRNLHRY